jgi:protein-S-isoprenylcysteine O-methyltransferase Ste14
MATSALIFLGVYFFLCFGVRSVVQKIRTGSTGFRGISGELGSTEWVGGVLFAVALGLGVLAPVLDLAGALDPIAALDQDVVRQAGGGMYFGGLVTTLVAQMAMGRSWRIGVGPAEKTELVTDGPFSVVRNPIFTGMVPTSLGIALLVPNAVAIAAVGLLLVALQIQTRLVEEPYLLSVHGRTYRRYAQRTGRFVPLLGRLR